MNNESEQFLFPSKAKNERDLGVVIFQKKTFPSTAGEGMTSTATFPSIEGSGDLGEVSICYFSNFVSKIAANVASGCLHGCTKWTAYRITDFPHIHNVVRS